MSDTPDAELLEQFARNHSEAAFAGLVSRYIGLVYSTAFRKTENPQHAEDITQAVFIILARKAGSLGPKTVLPGWLYHTTRLTAANFQRAELRRIRREQEVYMQSTMKEPAPDTLWRELSPLLEDAMAGLGASDRDAIVLRFFQNRSLADVGMALGIAERAAQKRVNRALEKLRKFFTKRGVVSTTAIIAGALSSNSVQAAPAALAQSVTALAMAHGATASLSTLTLVKGALKVMAWSKMQTAVVAGVVAVLVIGTTTSTVIFSKRNPNQQRLEDGSVLSISQVLYGDKIWPGHEQLVVKFKLAGKHAAGNILVKPPFFRPARGMLYGEQGIEYAQEIEPMNGFKRSGDDYYGEIATEIIPRDSPYLWLRIEESPTNRPYGNWQTMATFRIPNPAAAANYHWMAGVTPITNTVNGMGFVLRDVILTTNSDDERDIWNHKVAMTTEVWTNGMQLTNWAPVYINAGDASGNHVDYFQMHRSLDPRFVWKLDMDFEMISNFPAENVCTVPVPRRQNASVKTNVMGAPVTVKWTGQWVEAEMPTNYPDLALKFVGVADRQGNTGQWGAGSWNQHYFNEGGFMVQKNSVFSFMARPATVTFAVVPSVKTVFYVQPRLLAGQ